MLIISTNSILQNQWLQLLAYVESLLNHRTAQPGSIQPLIKAETSQVSPVPVLIQEVHSRPCIWKVNSREYQLMHKRKQAWINISLKLNHEGR